MADSIALMPWPANVAFPGDGTMSARAFAVEYSRVRTPRLERAVARSLGDSTPGGAPLVIGCHSASGTVPSLGDDEAYSLRVMHDRVELEALQEWGVMRGLATLAQLLHGTASTPAVMINDSPRFPWRGLLLDVARHFMSVRAVERTLDGMAAAKLNVLHLHLTDDQGFRFPSARFPDLPRLGGRGAHYTREELGSLVAYAADRGIRIVPEIDVPGHVTSWLAAVPDWGARRRRLAPSRRFGVHRACLDPSNETVYRGLAELFAEVAAVFPDEYIHVGGDEVNPTWWRTSKAIARWMADEGLADVAAAQARFSARLVEELQSLGRKAVGWDEVLHESLPKSTLIQSWRGAITRDRALAAGFDCLFSAGYYLDLFYPADIHYRFDPEATPDELAATEAGLTDDPRLKHVRAGLQWARGFAAKGAAPAVSGQSGRVLGGEACLWAELVDESVLDVRLWSRLPAVAERFWSPRDTTDEKDMARRLDAFGSTLARVGIDLDATVRAALAARGLNDAGQRALRPLMEALEPAKWYMRLLGKAALAARVEGVEASPRRPYNVESKLDRLADLLPPESPAARTLRLRATRGEITEAERESLAVSWRDQLGALVRLARRQRWLRDALPLATVLADLADVVDGTLTGAAADTVLARAYEPHNDLVLAVTPAVEALRRG